MRKGIVYLANLVLFVLAFSSCSSSDRDLYVFIWSDYIKPGLIAKFEEENNCRVIIDTYDSNESMYAKLKLGASAYDIIFPSNYIFSLMQEQGMLQPIDLTAIPNAKYLDPHYFSPFNKSDVTEGIPYMVSCTGIGYRQDKIHQIAPSWSIFGNQKLKGRMTMLNDMREALGAALKFLGYSVNTINEKEIDEAVNILIGWKKNLAKFESEQFKNGIASAEYLVVQGYNGDILQIMQESPEVQFLLPDEGTMISIDLLVIPNNAPNKELAQSFINFLLDPQNAAENMAFTYFLTPNLGAYEKLSPALRNNPALFTPVAILKKSDMIENLGVSSELYYRAWDKVKRASTN
jgi:spermidine/putrescine transport system substrate-binding protein